MSIRLEDVRYRYPGGVLALDGITLTVEDGESVAIMGENGAGKTTLVKHFNGLLKPDDGRVVVDGRDTQDLSVAGLARQVGYVFQNPDDQLFARSVRAEVAFGPHNLGQGEAEIADNVQRALEAVGLEEAIDRHPYDLHRSHRKLVALAATLAMRTPYVVLDEPTTGQDQGGIERVAEVVEGLKAEGRTVITISHDMDFCAAHFSRVIVMAGGKVLADGRPSEVFVQEAVLAEAQIDAPQMLRLAQALGWDDAPLTVEDFLEAARRHLSVS